MFIITFFNLGYSYEELQEIKKNKKSQEIIKLRQKIAQNTILSPFPFKGQSFMDDPFS